MKKKIYSLTFGYIGKKNIHVNLCNVRICGVLVTHKTFPYGECRIGVVFKPMVLHSGGFVFDFYCCKYSN